MSGAETRLVGDFVTASRLLAAGDADSALRVVLPRQEPLERRVPAMVTVGALVSGTLAALARAEPATGSVRALVELMMGFAALERAR